nr:lysine histidine transporter-like 6 [Tanacetum cinerariifolium]
MPLFDLMEKGLVKKLNVPSGLPLRLLVRTTYVAFTLFMAVTFPFFGDLL